jgi:hypothetical protein
VKVPSSSTVADQRFEQQGHLRQLALQLDKKGRG